MKDVDRLAHEVRQLEAALNAARSEAGEHQRLAWRESTRATQMERALVKTEEERDACRHALRKIFEEGCHQCRSMGFATAALLKVRQGAP